MAKKAATPTTVTLKHLAAALSEQHELSKKKCRGHSDRPGQPDHQAPEEGRAHPHRRPRHPAGPRRAARMGRNPATGEAIKIKASKKVAFRAAKELKEAV